MEVCNKLLDVADFDKPEWRDVVDEMHRLMKVPAPKRDSFQACTDRRNLICRAEIESYKHWEYPWVLYWGEFTPGLSVLDCGCGRGFLQFYLALKGCQVTSVDVLTLKTKLVRRFWRRLNTLAPAVREDQTSAMRKLARSYGVQIEFHVASIARLEAFADQSFDRVYSISVLEHLDPGADEQAVKEMSRVLKPGGKLLISVDFSPEPMLRRSYGVADIYRLIEISGLTLSGNTDFSISNWQSHLNDLRECFQKPDVELSTAGFVLTKA